MNKEKPRTEYITYLGDDGKKQVRLNFDSYDNRWQLYTQGRRSYTDFKGDQQWQLIGKKTRLFKFTWFAGRLFVNVDHQSASHRGIKNWVHGLAVMIVEAKNIKETIFELFGVEIQNLFWKKHVNASAITPKKCDWIETYEVPVEEQVSLRSQADEKVLAVQNAMVAQDYLRLSDHREYAYCLDKCIETVRSALENVLTLDKAHILTLTTDMPISLLNAKKEVCKRKLASFAKPYEKWLAKDK